MPIFHAVFDGECLIITQLECEDIKNFINIKKTEFTKSYHINKRKLEQVTCNRYNILSLYTMDNDERLIRQKMFDFIYSKLRTNKIMKHNDKKRFVLEHMADKINQYGLWELEKKYKAVR